MSSLLQQPWNSLHLEPPKQAPGGGRPSVQFGVPLGRHDDGARVHWPATPTRLHLTHCELSCDRSH
eukprot:7383472-Prymnesium_polylepis.1